jgi:hypothetical protein
VLKTRAGSAVSVEVVFPSGRVVPEWLGSQSTFGIYDNLGRGERIHGHGGKTRIVFTRSAIQVKALFVRIRGLD